MSDIFNYEHPFVCTDGVIFTITTEDSENYRKLPVVHLRVLLYKRSEGVQAGKWGLPGGFLNIDELPDDNIRRKLLEKSSIADCWLEQLFTFCAIDRDPRARVLSIAYLGLLPEVNAGSSGCESVWFDVVEGSDSSLFFQWGDVLLTSDDIAFDHYDILRLGLDRLRSKLLYSDIVFHLMPETFSLTALQSVYEEILNKKDLAANFRRKVGFMVESTGDMVIDKGHRPAKLYRKRA